MKNFQFKNPTKIIFGKDTIPKLSKELKIQKTCKSPKIHKTRKGLTFKQKHYNSIKPVKTLKSPKP